jgi:hypothetical protein
VFSSSKILREVLPFEWKAQKEARKNRICGVTMACFWDLIQESCDGISRKCIAALHAQRKMR